MGFSTAFTTIATNGLVHARDLTGDMAPLLAIVVGIAGLGMIVGVFRKFMT